MKYMLICNNCNHKIFTDGKDLQGLTQVMTAPLPKRANGKDKSTAEQPKKFKCPKCGYLLHIVKLTQPTPEDNNSEIV